MPVLQTMFEKESKEDFRKKAFRKYCSLSMEQLMEENEKIYQLITSLPEVIAAPALFIYYGVNHEVHTEKVIHWAVQEGKKVAIPITLEDGKLSFAEHVGCLTPIEHGVLEPMPGAKLLIPAEKDVVIVPGICFDRMGHRVGRGGGCFDRLSAYAGVFTIGLCHEEMLSERIPYEEKDVTVDAVITGQGIVRTRR